MSVTNLVNNLGFTNAKSGGLTGATQMLKGFSSGGLAGGAVAGGVVAMLLGNKSIRKSATTAAKYGGAAVLGGLAYKAYKNWQGASGDNTQTIHHTHTTPATGLNAKITGFEQEALAHANGQEPADEFQLALIKAMIASARADGSIDSHEQSKISVALSKLDLDPQVKSEVLELFLQPININDFVYDGQSTEQKAEIYLASCLAIHLDHETEYAYLSNLSKALALPSGLEYELRKQAASVTNEVI